LAQNWGGAENKFGGSFAPDSPRGYGSAENMMIKHQAVLSQAVI